MGASFPWTIKRIREITPRNLEVSCTLGDLPNLPGSAALAALGAVSTGVDYVKVSLYGLRTAEEATYLMENLVKAVKSASSSTKVVAAGYADAERIGSVNPMLVPFIARQAGCDVAMIDTAVKDGKNLLAFLNTEGLKAFVNHAHDLGLKAALAGSLNKTNLSLLCSFGVDILGVRGAACTGGDRVNGRIARQNVRELVDVVRNADGLR